MHSSNRWTITPKKPRMLKRLLASLYAFFPLPRACLILLPEFRSKLLSGQVLPQISVSVSSSVRLPSMCHLSDALDDHRLVYAAISSISLSLIATGIDACFDFGSNLFLYLINKQAEKMDVNKWPVGGARLETIGNIIYGEMLTGLFPVTCPHSCHKVPCSLVSQPSHIPWADVCTECPRSISLSSSSPSGRYCHTQLKIPLTLPPY